MKLEMNNMRKIGKLISRWKLNNTLLKINGSNNKAKGK